MKSVLNKSVGSALLAMGLGVGSFLTPAISQAEISATFGMSNMYLWRGQNVSPNGGQISGSLDYGHESGFYAGVWTSSEDEGHETDLYLGYGGSIGDFGYDVSWWEYMYPENSFVDDQNQTQTDISDNDVSELVVSLSYGPVSVGAYIQTDSDANADNYYTLSGNYEKFSATYGFWSLEETDSDGDGIDDLDQYSHLTLGYAATDELSFAVSFAFSDLGDGGVQENPLFQAAWAKSFDLK